MTPVLYLTRTGLLEPLGESQVLGYLRGLSREFKITLISMEREDDLADLSRLSRIEDICAAHRIHWIFLRYRRRPRIVASSLNLVALFLCAWREARRRRPGLIHARAYIPAAAAWMVSRIVGVPYIFDMRSLWPEELVTSRRLRRGSLLHGLIFWAEGRLMYDAAMVISLTNAAVDYLAVVHPGKVSGRRIRVIPTCADLDRFSPPAVKTKAAGKLIGCHGSLFSGWFRVDLLAAMFSRLMDRLPEARLEIITREDPEKVRAALKAASPATDWAGILDVAAARPSDIHGRLQQHDLSVFFYASGAASELGRSPTRMGESLGCGVPVLTNAGVGDVARIVSDGGVGVILEGEGSAAMDLAVDQAVALLSDPEVSRRCREVAEKIYSLEVGVADYASVYRMLTSRAEKV